jgi:hypothetical protein
MARRDDGWTAVAGGRLPADEQEVDFMLAGLGNQVFRGTFRAEKRPYTDGVKWVFVTRDASGRSKAHRHGVTHWRPAGSAAAAAAKPPGGKRTAGGRQTAGARR